MTRFILMLFAACAIGTGVASALDDAATENESLKSATRKELLAKIANLEQQLTELKSQQKQRDVRYEAASKHLTYRAPLTGQTPVPTPLPPGIFALPEYQDTRNNGRQYPKMPNAHRDPLSDMPKGTSARQFNGMTVYNVPCTYRSVNGAPEYASPATVTSQPGANPVPNLERRLKRQLELQSYPQALNK